jgi:hypothetical protein
MKESQMSDQKLFCKECGRGFLFTVGEQRFYSERGFEEPRRCQECRAKRKTDADQPSPREGAARRGSR